MMLERFGLRDWPFTVVPTLERGVQLWADRSTAKSSLDAVVAEWHVNRSSTITLLWADLGAGKTHTLYYLAGECRRSGMQTQYVLLPTAVGGFLGLYRAIADSFDWDAVAKTAQPRDAGLSGRSLWTSLRWLSSDIDKDRQSLAQRWLLGEKLRSRDCTALGVSGPIVTVDDAVRVLGLSIRAVTSNGSRFVLLVDEYQRVAEGSRRQLQEVGHGIHTLFNSCPNSLSLVVSCATGMSDDYSLVLTDEIVSRLSPKRIELPYLTRDDAVVYAREVLAHYRTDSAPCGDGYFPFSERVVGELAEFLCRRLDGGLTVRRLNKALSELLSAAQRNAMTLPVEDSEFTGWLTQEGERLISSIER